MAKWVILARKRTALGDIEAFLTDSEKRTLTFADEDAAQTTAERLQALNRERSKRRSDQIDYSAYPQGVCS